MNVLEKNYTKSWKAYLGVEKHGQLTLSNIVFTIITLCNMSNLTIEGELYLHLT